MSAIPVIRDGLSPAVARVLAKVHPDRWPLFALRLDSETGEIALQLRSELAAWLRANDLGELAEQATRRKVPRGSLLALILRDDGPHWHVFFDKKGKKR